ncbi:unnamed protein product [Mytilus edulis]|uniref:Peptidase C76 domain-containing protein n=1 Tax=Mytilus edulis TaxID=6550 RepID=A0A8S3SXK6_MYTED|nr:unnamed protein product [Mytilus edulis]
MPRRGRKKSDLSKKKEQRDRMRERRIKQANNKNLISVDNQSATSLNCPTNQSVNSLNCPTNNDQSINSLNCPMQLEQSVNSINCPIQLDQSVTSINCPILLDQSVTSINCPILLDQSVNSINCPIQLDQSINSINCPKPLDQSVNSINCPIQQDQSVNSINCPIQLDQSVNSINCPIQLDQSVNSINCPILLDQSVNSINCPIKQDESINSINCLMKQDQSVNSINCPIKLDQSVNSINCPIKQDQSFNSLNCPTNNDQSINSLNCPTNNDQSVDSLNCPYNNESININTSMDYEWIKTNMDYVSMKTNMDNESMKTDLDVESMKSMISKQSSKIKHNLSNLNDVIQLDTNFNKEHMNSHEFLDKTESMAIETENIQLDCNDFSECKQENDKLKLYSHRNRRNISEDSSFHQGDTRFGIDSGKQCVANCLSALAHSKIKDLNDWDPMYLDNVLIDGNEIYRNIHGNNTHLLVSDLPGMIDMSGKLLEISRKESITAVVDTSGTIDFSAFGNSLPLDQALQESLIDYDACFICAYDTTFLALKHNQELLLFDSHARNELGLKDSDESHTQINTSELKLSEILQTGNKDSHELPKTQENITLNDNISPEIIELNINKSIGIDKINEVHINEVIMDDESDIEILSSAEIFYDFIPLHTLLKRKLCKIINIPSKYISKQNSSNSYKIGPPIACKTITGDGNCLFRAISYSLSSRQEYFGKVRRAIVDHLMRNAEIFSNNNVNDQAIYLQHNGDINHYEVVTAVTQESISLNGSQSRQEHWKKYPNSKSEVPTKKMKTDENQMTDSDNKIKVGKTESKVFSKN